jgi:Tfp pilus assembly protein PilZ
MGRPEERREFLRVSCSVPVKYKFLSRIRDYPEMETIYDGVTRNLSKGGLLLEGEIPDVDWASEILTQKIVIGVNLFLANAPNPVKALTRIAWIEPIATDTRLTAFGLMFKEIDRVSEDLITQFVIREAMRESL